MNVFSHCYVIQTNAECIVPIGQWVIVADIWVKDIENMLFLISSVSVSIWNWSSFHLYDMHIFFILKNKNLG